MKCKNVNTFFDEKQQMKFTIQIPFPHSLRVKTQNRLIEMKNKKEPHLQTGAYLPYVTV